ncbi:MAG: divalent-cation tolerance protein CutA [Methylococcales bacterium]
MSVCYQLILCTCPDQASAEKIAQLLVNEHLAACVNVIPGITSFYAWNNQLQSAQEHLLLIKANQDHYPALETTIKNNHPYELPEIIAISIDQGLPEYLNWIDACHRSQ